jgi:hypothetical protein
MDKMEKNTEGKQIRCPYGGIFNDSNTMMSFPSMENRCYKIKPQRLPNLAHQEKYCLTSSYPQCTLLAQETKKTGQKIPNIFINPPGRQRTFPTRIVVSLILILIIAFLAYKIIPPLISTSASAPTTTWAMVSTLSMETAMPAATFAPRSTPMRAKPTSTSTPLPRLAETPIGLKSMFIVHRVIAGESLASLAEAYKTTKEVIQKLNYKMGDTLWIDTLVVLPVEGFDLTGVPPMSAYVADSDNISIDALASEKSVDVDSLLRWNAVPKGYVFRKGEAVIIPHGSPG